MEPLGVYAPDEIQNSMFLPLMNKALMGGKGKGDSVPNERNP